METGFSAKHQIKRSGFHDKLDEFSDTGNKIKNVNQRFLQNN